MTTSEIEQKLERFKRFGSKLGLERIEELLKRLGNPHKEIKVIHVAGTNGKGSVCRYIYEILQANGYKTGIYTSPYIEDFSERIEFDGQQISSEDLDKFFEITAAAADEMVKDGLESPTEFEIITAMAFAYYAAKKPDFVVMEVGLGGRGDSTNVIIPEVSVITSISFDHMDRLGNTLEEIAGEKAGIIKPGVPVVTAVTAISALKTIARIAYQNGSVLHDSTKNPKRLRKCDENGSLFDLWIGKTFYPDVRISMCGVHQVENAICALTAIELLRQARKISLNRAALDAGIIRARQKARFESFGSAPEFVLDGAHNTAGMKAMLSTAKLRFEGKKVVPLIGILADKSVDEMLDLIEDMSDVFVATEPDSPRKMKAAELAHKLVQRGKVCFAYEDPDEALSKARELAGAGGVVLCTGSLYLMGHIRRRVNA